MVEGTRKQEHITIYLYNTFDPKSAIGYGWISLKMESDFRGRIRAPTAFSSLIY